MVRRVGFRAVRADFRVVPVVGLGDLVLAADRGEIVPAGLREVRGLRGANRADRKGLIPSDRRDLVGRKRTPPLALANGADVKVAQMERDAAARGAGVDPAVDLAAPASDLADQEWEAGWSWIRWSACRMPASRSAAGCWLCRNCAGGIWPM